MSDFALSLGSAIGEDTATLNTFKENTAKALSDLCVNIVTDLHKFEENLLIEGEEKGFDIFNTIGLSEDTMKRLGLFNNSLVEVSLPAGQSHTIQKMSTSETCAPSTVVSVQQNQRTHFAVVRTLDDKYGSVLCGTAYVLQNLIFNLGADSNVDCDNRLIIKKLPMLIEEVSASHSQSWHAALPYASEIHLSLVYSPDYPSVSLFGNALQKHFTVPRLVAVGDILVINAEADPEYQQSLGDGTSCRSPIVYYKVQDISPKLPLCHTYQTDIHHSNFYQDGPVHSYIPCTMRGTLNPKHSVKLGNAGLQEFTQKLVHLIEPYLQHRRKSVDVLPTVLLSGPAGCGKCTIASQVAAHLNMHIFMVNCHELCGETSASSEARIKAVMHRAVTYSPCILLMKSIHALGKDREGMAEDPRVANSFHEILRRTLEESRAWPVVVIATTSLLKEVSPDMQEGFLHHVTIQTPNEDARLSMLKSLLEDVPCSSDVSVKHIAQRTAGLVLGDLYALISHAKSKAHHRITKSRTLSSGTPSWSEEESLVIAGVQVCQEDFVSALDQLQSTHSDSIGAPKIPNVTWSDVGGLADVKSEILDTIQLPLQHPELFVAGLRRSGVLLYGPPGTGKTLLAKAVATECSLNFLSVKGPELINMYVGQSEENVREVFNRARSATPCVIFFDELDSLAPNRGRSGDSGGVMDRVVSQLLAELDGLHKSCDVFVIGATNRPDLLDPALLRPGRFDKLLYLGVSDDKESQLNVIKALTRKFHLSEGCDLERVVSGCPHNMTGADFYALCSDAMLQALKRKIALLETGVSVDQSQLEVEEEDFMKALASLVPSVSEIELLRYSAIQTHFKQQK